MKIKGEGLIPRTPFILLLIIVVMVFISIQTEAPNIFYEAWKSIYKAWKSFTPELRELITVIVPLLGILLGVFVAIAVGVFTVRQGKRLFSLQQERERILKDELAFPFEVFSSSDLGKLKKSFLGPEANIEHLPRFPEDRQQNFESQLDTQFLLLTGRAGLGKTRECIEMIGRLAEHKGEEITVLRPSAYINIPTKLPPEMQRARNVVLLIDDIHRQCMSAPGTGLDSVTRTYYEKLADTIEWLKEQFEGRDFRIVITARDEPDLRKRLNLEGHFWKLFKEYQLPGVHRDARQQFIHGIAKHLDLSVDEQAVNYIMGKSDGTCAGIISSLRRKSLEHGGKPARVTVENLRGYNFVYPSNWEEQVYKRSIMPFAARKAVFEALAALHDLRMLPYQPIVTCLALRLWRGRLGLFKRKRIKKAIRQDLRAWIFEYKGDLVCPAAYLEGKAVLKDALPKLVKCVKKSVRKPRQLERLLPGLLSAAYTLGDEFAWHTAAIEILEAATRSAGNSSALWITLATNYARIGRHGESLNAARNAVTADEKDPDACIAFAYSLTRLGHHSQALDASHKATSLDPDYYFSWLNLGVLLSKVGDHEEAVKALRRACELNPDSAKGWYSLGVAYDRKGEYEKAREACLRAITLAPFEAAAWHNLGITYDRKGDSEEAIKALEQARDLDDSQASTWLSLGRAYLKGGRQEEGLTALSEAEVRARENASLYVSLSKGYGIAGFHEHAVEAARKAVEIEPTLADGWRSLAINLQKLGKLEESVEAQRTAVKLSGEAEDWYHLSVAYGTDGHYEHAVEAARKAVEIEPTLADGWRSLAINLEQLGKEEKAASAWLKLDELTGNSMLEPDAAIEAVNSAPKSTATWRALATTLKRLGQCDRAISIAIRKLNEFPEISEAVFPVVEECLGLVPRETIHLLEALSKLNAGNPEIWHLLCVARRKARCPEAAIIEAGSEAIRIDPNKPAYWYTLALAHEDLNQIEKAKVAYKQALQLKPDYLKARERLSRLT